jgi:hypothetical protein
MIRMKRRQNLIPCRCGRGGKKPGALAGSTPLAQWRKAGRWPECFDRLWQALNMRQGWQDDMRQMIEQRLPRLWSEVIRDNEG